MNKYQSKYFRMFLNTQEYLDNHTPVWTLIPRIVSYKNVLDGLISRIVLISEEAAQIIGVGERKDILKLLLGIKVSSLAGQLLAFAHDKSDLDLAKAVDITKTDIARTKDENVDSIIKAILKVARDNLEALAEYGVTEGTLTEILSSLDEFNGYIGKPRDTQNEKFVKNDTLDALVEETIKHLKDKMDNIMLMYRETNPEFYNGYLRARVVVDR